MTKLSSVQGVTLRTPSFATTTTTASLSQGTFARLVEGIGPKAAPLGTFLWVVGVERTRRFHLKNPMTNPTKTTLDHHHHLTTLLIFSFHFQRSNIHSLVIYLAHMGHLVTLLSWRLSIIIMECLRIPLGLLILWRINWKL